MSRSHRRPLVLSLAGLTAAAVFALLIPASARSASCTSFQEFAGPANSISAQASQGVQASIQMNTPSYATGSCVPKFVVGTAHLLLNGGPQPSALEIGWIHGQSDGYHTFYEIEVNGGFSLSCGSICTLVTGCLGNGVTNNYSVNLSGTTYQLRYNCTGYVNAATASVAQMGGDTTGIALIESERDGAFNKDQRFTGTLYKSASGTWAGFSAGGGLSCWYDSDAGYRFRYNGPNDWSSTTAAGSGAC